MKTKLTFIFIIISLGLIGQTHIVDSIEIQIIDSPLTWITLLKHGCLVKDTNADWDGKFNYKYELGELEQESIFIFRGPGVYPEIRKLRELIKEPIVEFIDDSVSMNSGGMESSEKRLQMGTEIDKMIRKWNMKNQ